MKALYVLPFDHRSSFLKNMFGISGREPSTEEAAEIADVKHLIYEGFVVAVKSGDVPAASAAILVDEQFGDKVLRDATKAGYLTCLCVEKSGQDEFDFEYGEDFGAHIEKYKPTIVKALIRYNPEGDSEINQRQRSRLKMLNDFCHQHGYQLMIEPLIPATSQQLAWVENDTRRYDNELRPALMVKMISEMQADGIETDIWKIEGLEKAVEYEEVVKQAKAGGRDHVVAIVLGRGADQAQVEQWLKAGAAVDGVVGFAVGRTIFWQPLVDFRAGKINRQQAATQIAERYTHFYHIFIQQ